MLQATPKHLTSAYVLAYWSFRERLCSTKNGKIEAKFQHLQQLCFIFTRYLDAFPRFPRRYVFPVSMFVCARTVYPSAVPRSRARVCIGYYACCAVAPTRLRTSFSLRRIAGSDYGPFIKDEPRKKTHTPSQSKANAHQHNHTRSLALLLSHKHVIETNSRTSNARAKTMSCTQHGFRAPVRG